MKNEPSFLASLVSGGVAGTTVDVALYPLGLTIFIFLPKTNRCQRHHQNKVAIITRVLEIRRISRLLS
jgi:hypothetical protein